MNGIHLIDTTLRDGERAAGVASSRAEKKTSPPPLLAVGVPEIYGALPFSRKVSVTDDELQKSGGKPEEKLWLS